MALPKIILPDSEEQRIKTLRALYKDAQTGLRRVVAFGLYCFQVKAAMPHGQFMNWMAKELPEISGRSARAHMGMTANVLEACGVKVSEYLQIGSALPICRNGKFLLMPEKKVPEAVKPLRDKICALVDGKTQRQLQLEFTQVEDDGEELRSKRGRLKGSSGLTKEQRAAAKQREHAAEISELKQRLEDLGDECDELADAKHAGNPEVRDAAEAIRPKVENFFRFLQSLK